MKNNLHDKSRQHRAQVIITAKFLNAVTVEVASARNKFPDNKHQLTAFAEEAGELHKAVLQNHYDKLDDSEAWKEAVQAAAMALRVATEGDSTFNYDPEKSGA